MIKTIIHSVKRPKNTHLYLICIFSVVITTFATITEAAKNRIEVEERITEKIVSSAKKAKTRRVAEKAGDTVVKMAFFPTETIKIIVAIPVTAAGKNTAVCKGKPNKRLKKYDPPQNAIAIVAHKNNFFIFSPCLRTTFLHLFL
jgi:hypothetical protein